MRLDPDCIRDILLTVEDHATFDKYVGASDFENDGLVGKYGEDKLLYHIREASEAGLLDKLQFFMGGGFIVRDLTPAGHNFLADIRSDNNWHKTKEVAAKVGSTSVNALTSIASSVIASVIQKTLHLD